MKLVNRLTSSLLLVVMIASVPLNAVADCDFSKDVQVLPDGRYAYSLGCHKRVGKMVQDDKDRQTEIDAKDVQIKNLGVQVDLQTQRANNWMDTSLKMENDVNTMERMKATNQWLYFGLGMLATGMAVWGAGQLRH